MMIPYIISYSGLINIISYKISFPEPKLAFYRKNKEMIFVKEGDIISRKLLQKAISIENTKK